MTITNEPSLDIPGAPAVVSPPPALSPGQHISAAAQTVLTDVLDRLKAGENVVVTSAEDLIGGKVTFTTLAGKAETISGTVFYSVAGLCIVSIAINIILFLHR